LIEIRPERLSEETMERRILSTMKTTSSLTFGKMLR